MIKTREFEPGQVVFRENDPGETAFLIKQGRVEILKHLGTAKVHIAYIHPNEPFGEMSMIDQKPRSATAVAVERTVVQELHRDDFLENLESHPKIAMNLLKLLFERLREADSTIAQLHKAHPELKPTSQADREAPMSASTFLVTLQGLTEQARDALPEDPLQITRFPFRIGRQGPGAQPHNDLALPDKQPFQISRHHLSIIQAGNRIGISDRGNTIGSLLDGQRLGGQGSRATTIFLSGTESTLVLGNDNSPYRFRVTVGLSNP
jgi:CRP-like cAMP-binding protein